MSWSVTLARIRGIDVKVHLTFLLLLGWVALGGWLGSPGGLRGVGLGLLFTILLFGCVVLHELAHSLTAVRFGGRVRNILLLPIGGLAQMERIPDKPVQELLVALSGPVVNLVLAGLLALLIGITLPDRAFVNARLLPLFLELGPWWQRLALQLLEANIVLAVFNLLPAFPMDGGRVLRAFLALPLGHRRATRIASKVGQSMAVLFAVLGFAGMLFGWGGGVWLLLVALFVFSGAAEEGRSSQIRTVLGDVQVEQILSSQVDVIQPTDPLRVVLDRALQSEQTSFPVVEGGQLVGFLDQRTIISGSRRHGPDVPVSRIMRTDVPTASPDDSLPRIRDQMLRAGMDALPVVDGDRFRGLVTLRQIGQVYKVLQASRAPASRPPTAGAPRPDLRGPPEVHDED